MKARTSTVDQEADGHSHTPTGSRGDDPKGMQ
jgi:hypothetical protein